jgi:hypothetical protein
MKPRDFLNFFKTKSGKLVAFGAVFAAALIIFSVVRKHHPSTEDGIQCHGSGHQRHGQTPGGAVRHAANAGLLIRRHPSRNQRTTPSSRL